MSAIGRLDRQNIVIIGGTSGIGLAAARRFLLEGARVVIAGHSEESGRAAIDALEPLRPECCLTGDVSVEEEVERLFARSVESLGSRLDILLHAAGISGRRHGDGPLHECEVEGWDRVLTTNARGAFLTNRAAVRQMRTQSINDYGLRGTIVNVGSVLAMSPSSTYFGTIAYAASKGALRSLTLSAAARYAPERIRFNLMEPALIETPMSIRATSDPRILAYLRSKQPIAGGPGTPEDCAEAALYLCEPASRFLTGAILPLDGGWSVSEGQRHEFETLDDPFR